MLGRLQLQILLHNEVQGYVIQPQLDIIPARLEVGNCWMTPATYFNLRKLEVIRIRLKEQELLTVP